MAVDQELPEVSAVASLLATDIMYLVRDPGGAGEADHKVAVSVLDARYPGNVTSVFGRTGAVVAVAGDYTAAQITGISVYGQTLVDDANAATARATLELGSLAVLNSPLPIANGGSGQITQQAAIDTLTNVAAATNEHVLTKDTATGNAIFKAAAGGTTLPVADTQTIVKGSVDDTKLLRFEVDGFSTGTTRVLTPPNQDVTIAGLEVVNQTFTVAQRINANLSLAASSLLFGTFGSEDVNLYRYAADTLATDDGLLFTQSQRIMQGANFYRTGVALYARPDPTFAGYGWFNNYTQNVIEVLSQKSTDASPGSATVLAQFIHTGQGTQMRVTGYHYVNFTTWVGNLNSLFQADADSRTPLAVRARASQTGDLIKIMDSSNVDLLTVASGGITTIKPRNAVTNAITNAAIVGHNSSGTPAAGFGTGIAIQGESSTTEDTDMGRLTLEWVTATHATRAARGKLSAYYTSTERECIRWEADSSNPLLGFLGATAVARPAAYTQTFSTADRTFAAYTSDPESSAYTGIDNAQAGTPYAQLTDLNALRVAYETLRVHAEDTAQLVNAILDDLQAYGLLA